MLLKKFVNSLNTYLLCFALVFSGCFKKQSQEGETDPAAASVPTETQNEGTGVAEQREAPATVDVNVFLEVSNGMKGFMPSAAAGKEPTVFQSNLNRLISEVQDGRYVDRKAFFLAKEDAQSQPVLDSVSYNTFKSYVVSGIKDDVRGTPLPAMLQAALEKSVAQEAVCVIISDFIHGPDPRDPGQFISLDSDIRSSLRLAERNNLSVAVLANTSAFQGTYHPAVKKPEVRRTLNGEEIPYYIWIIGKQEEVQLVTNKVLRNLPAQQAYFGFSYAAVPYAAVLKERAFKPMGVVYCTDRVTEACTTVNMQPAKDEPVAFTIGMDLGALPLSMQREAYLKQHLRVVGNGCKASLLEIKAADEEVKATPALARYTHFVRVQVPQLTANTGAVSLQLPQVYPAWVNEWSTDNDNNPAAAPGKTYQVNKIMDGVQALYRDRSENVFNLTMKFNKAD